MNANTRGISDGFHEETRKVMSLTSRVAAVKDGWTRGDNLNVSGVTAVSEIYAELSSLIAAYGVLAQKDTVEFDQFGVNIEVQDRMDARL